MLLKNYCLLSYFLLALLRTKTVHRKVSETLTRSVLKHVSNVLKARTQFRFLCYHSHVFDKYFSLSVSIWCLHRAFCSLNVLSKAVYGLLF
jgi:hypothetical protein